MSVFSLTGESRRRWRVVVPVVVVAAATLVCAGLVRPAVAGGTGAGSLAGCVPGQCQALGHAKRSRAVRSFQAKVRVGKPGRVKVREHDPAERRVKHGPFHKVVNRGKQSVVQLKGSRKLSAVSRRTDIPLSIYLSSDLQSTTGTSNASSGWEVSQARAGRVVFESGNYFAAYSNDSGSTFTYVDPFSDLGTGLPAGEGFCCDQQVIYARAVNRFIWIRQTSEATAGGNRYRLAVASPSQIVSSGGTSWTMWDITPDTFYAGGHTPKWWFDFPDVSVNSTNFFLSFNLIGSGGAILWRVPLARLAAGANLGGTPYLFQMCGGIRVAQNIGSRAWFACELSDSRIRSFFWDDSSTGYAWNDLNITTIPQTFSSIIPINHREWLIGSKIGIYLLGATLAGPEVWYCWSAGSGNGFTQPHIEYARITTATNTLASEGYVYNPDHTFVFPDIATNSQGEVGLTFSWGGGRWPVHSGVGFLTGNQIFVNASPDGQASGAHYSTIRQDTTNGNLFTVGNSFAPLLPDGTYANHAQFIVFGRPGS